MHHLSNFVKAKAPKRILSICIPTCNREAKLDRLLSNISAEIAGMHQAVEVCISDNGSTDGTGKVIARWARKLPLSSHRNPRNMGYDINALRALQLARGEFAMYIGDDDGFVPGSLAMLVHGLGAIRGREAGAVYLNHFVGRGALTDFGFKGIRIFEKGSRDCPPLNICFGGSVCLRTSYAARVMEKISVEKGEMRKDEPDPLLLYDFVHSYLFLECINESGSFAIVPEPVVSVIAGGASLSTETWFYIDLVFSLYYLQVRKFYPWAADSTFDSSAGVARHILRRYFGASYAIIGRPGLQRLFDMNLAVHKDILELEGKRWLISLLSLLERMRRAGILTLPLIAAARLYVHVTGNRDFVGGQNDTLNKPKSQIDGLLRRVEAARKISSVFKVGR